MSHLVCPLCGKNAPLSTLDPENQPLDLRTVSFRGLGRGKGFAVSEEVSIMGDDEYTPIIAKRIQELFKLFVEKGEIDIPIITSNDELYSKQIKDLERQTSEKNYKIHSLSNELDEVKDEYEIDKQVDYIIRAGLDLLNARSHLNADEDGWYLALSPHLSELECYLFLIMLDLPSKLKGRLLLHVKRDGNPLFYDMMLKKFPMRQNIAERLLDIGNETAFETVDEFGKQCVRILKPVYSPEFAGKSISFEELKRIVKNVKKSIRDPEFNPSKEVFETLYPLRLKIPLGRNDSDI
jgi:hypothetical protein